MPSQLDRHVAAYEGSNLYDFDNEIMLNWYPQRVIGLAGDTQSLLELGLGHGFTTSLFSERFHRHVVLEGSSAVIRNFRDKHPDCPAEIIETYFESFITNERFGVIAMGFILEHVDDPLLILTRFREFLVPGGRMFLTVPNAKVLNRRLGHLAGMLEDMNTLSENDLLLGHKRYFTVDSLRAVVTQSGCVVERLEGIYLKPFTTHQMISLRLDRKVLDALCAVGVDYPELSCGLLAEISVQ